MCIIVHLFRHLSPHYYHYCCLAERLFEIVVERKRSNKMSGGVVQSPMKTTKKPMKKVKKARLSSEEGFDPDMQVSSGDAVGRGSL